MNIRILHLIRHGQQDSQNSSGDKLGGRLTALGRKQAELTARRLSQLPISVIHHSDLRRAVETAEIIARKLPGVPLRQSRQLRECIPNVPAAFGGHFANVSKEELVRGHEQAKNAFMRYFKPARGGERHEIVVCHGNLIRYFVCCVLQASPDAWANMDIYNCGISEVKIEPNKMMLVCHNDAGHLPDALKTYV